MNDYQDPVEDKVSGENVVSKEAKKKLPVFVKTIAIIDLVCSCFRAVFLPLSIIGFVVMTADDPLRVTVIPEVISHLGILVAALWANIAILLRKRIGVPMGYANIAITGFSFILGIWQLLISVGNITDDSAIVAMMIGASFTLVFRTALLVLYVVAINKYKKYIEQSTWSGTGVRP